MTDTDAPAQRFAIFRREDARDLDESGVMTSAEAPTPIQMAGIRQLAETGYANGHATRLLFTAPGMSLAHAWFKSGFPLPRHSHDSDCLYYIVAGSLRIGTEELGPGDGFFVGGDVPYSYTPGDDGVEVLEFRTAGSFDIRLLANNAAWWTKAAQVSRDRQDAWANETTPPSERSPAQA